MSATERIPMRSAAARRRVALHLAASVGWASAGWAAPGPASAVDRPAAVDERVDEDVARGIEAYENAALGDALAAFERAESGASLERADLVLLLRTRMLVHYAMSATAPMQRDAAALVSLEPTLHDAAWPPDVRRAVERARERRHVAFEVNLRGERTPGGLRLHASVAGDAGGLVRDVRIGVRRRGAEEWEEFDARVDLALAPNESVDAYAFATGPGGVTLVRRGAPATPLRFARETTPLPPRLAAATARDEGDGTDDGPNLVPFVLTGAAVLTAAALVTAVLVLGAEETPNTRIGAPSIE